MKLIDTHCHLDVSEFDQDRDEILQRCRVQGVTRMVIPAIDAAHWCDVLKLCDAEKGLYPALGLHPMFLNEHKSEHIEALEHQVNTHAPIAIGEIGLDYFKSTLDREKQQTLFEAQLEIAKANHLPVVLHVRKAHDQVLATLKRIRVKGGTAHAFNGSLQQAQQYLELGFKLGFGGMLTYDRAQKLHRLARQLPLESIVLETDAPDMTVASHHGQRNSPEYLPECLQALATLRDEDPLTIAEQTTRNACSVFSLD